MNRYFALWKILWSWKGHEPFSTAEFSLTFASASPRKVLFDLVSTGLIKRMGRNSYVVVSPDDLAREDYFERIREGYESLKDARLKYAFTRVDGVMKWSRGAYNANRFFGFYPIHIKVRKADLPDWKKFFSGKKADFVVWGQPKRGTLFGVFYILYPEDNFRMQTLDGEPVEPLAETVRYCKGDMATFEHALEILDKLYGLGLKVRYEHGF